ncbi:MAG: hypothetical protein NVSMB45_11080 [Ginsengibacter sp.]
MIPGEYFLKKDDVICNVGSEIITIDVVNLGDRPVQIGSHFHFFEVNKQMQFDREKALGKRLNIASGTAVRFEPGEQKTVEIISVGGNKIINGFSNLVNGDTHKQQIKAKAINNLMAYKFKNSTDESKH